jgi:hypothetical protein
VGNPLRKSGENTVTSEEIEPLNAVGVSQEDSAEASVAAMEEGDCQDGKKRKEHPPPPQNRFKVLGQMIMAMKRFQGEARQQALYSNMPQVLDRATTFLVLVQLPPRLSGCRRMFFFFSFSQTPPIAMEVSTRWGHPSTGMSTPPSLPLHPR